MGQHYAKSMVGEKTPAWCASCGRMTDHVIVSHTEHAAKLGHCVDPAHPRKKLTQAQQRRKEQAEHERQNPRLF